VTNIVMAVSAALFSSCMKTEQATPEVAGIAEKSFTMCTGSCDDLSEEPYNFICVLPSETGSGIYADFNDAHMVSTPTVASNGTLLLFLIGTNIEPNSCSKFYKKANDLGYHVIALSYVNASTVANPCAGADGESLEEFAREVFFGKNIMNSAMTEVNAKNCTNTRLINLFKWLITNYPTDGWSQFYNATTGKIVWNKIVLAGRSQGGTHAAMIGSFKNVKRVICFSSPREMCQGISSVWPALSLSKYYCFTHTADLYSSQQAVWTAMGFTETPTDTDNTPPPYNNAHLLTTGVSTNQAHKCTTVNCNLPPEGFDDVWEYLLSL
jgi:hypothetical protein